MAPTTAPYGEWESPVTSESLTTATVGLSGVAVTEDSVFWQESRPSDGGRSAIVVMPLSGKDVATEVDVVPTATDDFSVQSRVHEYGGGSYIVVPELDSVFFVNLKDQRLWKVAKGDAGVWGPPVALTGAPTEDVSRRFADCVYDHSARRLIAVRESHLKDVSEAVSEIVAVDVNNGSEAVLASGRDFYSSPRLSDDGNSLAFVAWDHPAMPWDATGIFTSSLSGSSASESSLGDVVCVSGGKGYGEDGAVSAMQPQFNGNDLYYISDVSGWWSVYRQSSSGAPDKLVFGGEGKEVGGPAWMFGSKSYHFVKTSSASLMVVLFTDSTKPGAQACVVDLDNPERDPSPIDFAPLMNIGGLRLTAAAGSEDVFQVACVGGSPTMRISVAISKLDLHDATAPVVSPWKYLKASSTAPLDETVLSVPRVIAFPSRDGEATVYMNYYAPRNDAFVAPDDGSLPPLLIKSHGGPTSSASTAYSANIQ